MSDQADWKRLDTRVVWVDGVRALLSMVPMAFSVFVLGGQIDRVFVWSAAVVAILGLNNAVRDLLRWIKTRYRVTGEHIELRTGLFVRSHRKVRRDRIRSVDTSAKLRYRLAGLRIVTIGAGQQAPAKEPAFVLDAVSRATAGKLHDELLVTDTVEASVTTRPQVAPIATLRWSWLLFNVFNIWAFIMAAGILWGTYWTSRMFGWHLDRWALDLFDWQAIGLFWTVALAAGMVGALGVVGLAGNFVAEWWGFRLERVPGDPDSTLRTSQGLLSTRLINRDDARLRGIEIGEPLLWRWIGAADTNVITTGLAGGDMSRNSASLILPRGPVAEARRVASAVLRGDGPLAAPLRRHPGAALRRRMVWAVVATAVVIAVLALLDGMNLLPHMAWRWGVPVLPVGLLLAVTAYRNLGHVVAREYLVMRSGAMTRSTVVLQRRAVIGLCMRQSVFQRRLGLLSVTVTTGAGTGHYQVPDAATQDVLRFADTAALGLLRPFLSTVDD